MQMLRYALARSTSDGLQYLAAVYGKAGNGITYTQMRTDAGTYVTVEKAADVCRTLQRSNYGDFFVVPLEEA